MARLLAFFLLVGASGCLLQEDECPCGAERSAPWSAHDLSYAGTHRVADECVCRCGDGPRFATPRAGDGTCAADGDECAEGTVRCESSP